MYSKVNRHAYGMACARVQTGLANLSLEPNCEGMAATLFRRFVKDVNGLPNNCCFKRQFQLPEKPRRWSPETGWLMDNEERKLSILFMQRWKIIGLTFPLRADARRGERPAAGHSEQGDDALLSMASRNSE